MRTLLNLGTNRGIAGEFNLQSINDVMAFTPFRDEWHYCDGDHIDEVSVLAITSSGEIPLEQCLHVGDASNYVKDVDEEAPVIGEQIANLDVNALIFIRRINNQNEDQEYEEYLPLVAPDWKIVRRRVEDALRKTNNKEILFSFAQRLNVKIY